MSMLPSVERKSLPTRTSLLSDATRRNRQDESLVEVKSAFFAQPVENEELAIRTTGNQFLHNDYN